VNRFKFKSLMAGLVMLAFGAATVLPAAATVGTADWVTESGNSYVDRSPDPASYCGSQLPGWEQSAVHVHEISSTTGLKRVRVIVKDTVANKWLNLVSGSYVWQSTYAEFRSDGVGAVAQYTNFGNDHPINMMHHAEMQGCFPSGTFSAGQHLSIGSAAVDSEGDQSAWQYTNLVVA
jgi:hypothetical protein